MENCRMRRRLSSLRIKIIIAGAVTILPPMMAWAQNEQSDGEAPADLQTMVVVAGKTARPLSSVASQVTVIERDRLEREFVQELGDVARYEPALEADFTSGRFGATGLSIRGIGGNRVALEVDGVPLPQQFDVGNFADNPRTAVDAEIIQRIEIMRGPASALYGSDAIGGVMVIETLSADDLTTQESSHYGAAALGHYGATDAVLGHATAAYAGKQDGIVLAAGYREGEAPDTEARGIATDLIDFEQQQFFAKWNHDFVNGGELVTSVDYYRRETDSKLRALLGFDRFANTSELLGDDRQRRDRITVAFRPPQMNWLEQGSVMVYRQVNDTVQRTRERRLQRGAPVALARDFHLRETAYGGEAKGRWDFSTGELSHVLVSGVEWDHLDLKQQRDGTETNLNSGVARPVIIGETFPLRDFPLTQLDEVGVYLQDEIQLGSITLTPALRWDYFKLDSTVDAILTEPDRVSDLSRDDLTFRVGATWQPAPEWTLYAHYAEGFRMPPAEDVNLALDIPLFNIRAVPNPDLSPESSRNYETGLRLRQPGRQFDAAFYYSEFDDFIESRVFIGPDPATGTLLFQSRNLAEAEIHGVEASLAQDLGAWTDVLDDWSLHAGFHWARGNNRVSDRPLNEINPLKAIFALQWQPAGVPFNAAFRVRYLAEQQRVDMDDEEFFVPPSATIVDITADWRPRPWMHWQAGLFNLTDKRYWRYADTRRLESADPRVEMLSRPGRHLNLSLRLTL